MTGPPSDECHADAQEEDEQEEEEEGEEEEDEGGVHFYDSNDDDSYNSRDVEESSSSSGAATCEEHGGSYMRFPVTQVLVLTSFEFSHNRRISTINFFRGMAKKGYIQGMKFS